MVIRELRGVQVRFGGEGPSGWLPPGAAVPAPTPIHDELVDFEIIKDPSGYLLAWTAMPSPTAVDQGRLMGADNWYRTLEEAEQAALNDFGIAPEQWVKLEG